MPKLIFPHPDTASPEGLVAVGGKLTIDALTEAYSRGIFPWPHEDYPMLWFSPDPRGVLDFAELHIPRSLEKFIRKSAWKFEMNTAFREVMENCRQQPRPGQDGTWIQPEMLDAYERMFRIGKALSGEVRDEAGELVGGIYGVWINGVFSGESMFFKKPNASKVALVKMVEWLISRGCTWMDIQMVTSATEQLGGKLIPRSEYLKRLKS